MAEFDLANPALRAVATIAQVAIGVGRVVGLISSNFPGSTIRPYGGSAFRDALLELLRINIVGNGAQSSRRPGSGVSQSIPKEPVTGAEMTLPR